MANHRLESLHKGFYKGAYTVELQPGASTSHLPRQRVTIDGNKVSVSAGIVQQVMGGIQFYAAGNPFSWGYKFIRVIRDVHGEILWENWNNKK